MNNPTRRTVLAGMSAATLLASPAFALTTNDARGLIDDVVGQINSVINSGKSETAMYRDFEAIFKKYADVPTISRSALGPPARSASNKQLSDFADAFTTYLARKYGGQFRDFIGGEITVESARPVKSFQQVDAVAKRPKSNEQRSKEETAKQKAERLKQEIKSYTLSLYDVFR